jgi:hypothetical protein
LFTWNDEEENLDHLINDLGTSLCWNEKNKTERRTVKSVVMISNQNKVILCFKSQIHCWFLHVLTIALTKKKKVLFFFLWNFFSWIYFWVLCYGGDQLEKKWDFSIVPPFLLTAPSFIPLGKFRNVQTISATTFVIKITFVGL